jgi:ubiquinone/menaquinone biosynthesis C-methylase UbiE
MGFYGKHILPTLIELAMRNKGAQAERARFVPRASGEVLEIGVGSGLNIPIYGSGVRKLYALDPSAELLRMARQRAERAAFPVELLQDPAEAIPLRDGSVDTVVTTWTLCSIPDAVAALREMRRVLRPEGRLIFIEHGRSTDPSVVRWQDRVTPLWRKISGGCHLNRPIDRLLAQGGFEVSEIERGYMAGPRIGAYLYRGIARPTQGVARGRE